MKSLLVLLSLLLINKPPATLLIVDKNLKKPIGFANEFTLKQYFQSMFPLYKSDVANVSNAIDKTVKLIDKEKPCHTTDTFMTNQTTFYIHTDCEESKSITVMLVTQLKESNQSFSFTLVNKETNTRKAQRRLLDFATYIDQ